MFWVVGEPFFFYRFFLSIQLNSITLIELIDPFCWLNFHSILGASTLVIALHATFYNIDAIVTEEFDAFLAESETV